MEEDGKKGVYVVDKLENYNFTPIKILDQNGDVVVVEKNYFYDANGNSVRTVQNYDTILRPGAESSENSEEPEKETPEAENKKKEE